MNTKETFDAMDKSFGGLVQKWMDKNNNTPPQSLRDGIAAALAAAFYGSGTLDELVEHLRVAENQLWLARMEVERVRAGF